VIENITIDKKDISVIGTNKDTLKFSFNGITYIKFKAKELINEISTYDGKLNISAAGRGNINEWGGKRTPQILLEEIEIKESGKYDF